MQPTYRVKKVLNNNVVSATRNLQEVIVVGMGIGFQSKVHDKIDPRKVEKVFELRQEDIYKTTQLVQEIPEHMFYDLYRMITGISEQFKMHLDAHAYVTLIDHIHFAIERYKSGQDIKNMMMYELEIIYSQEFKMSKALLERVNQKLNLNLPDDEIGFLTMHIVNGSMSEIHNQSSIMTDLVLSCLNMIRDHYLISLKMKELATQRIAIHVRMLIQRVMSNTQVDFEEPMLYNIIVEFDNAYKCALSIQQFIEERLNKKINSQELVYLTIHLNRLEMMNKDK